MLGHDPIDLSSQADAQASAEERARLSQQREIDDLKWLLSNRRGRRFALGLLERAGVWRLSFNTNALSMAFNEGARNEGLKLMALITTHCPDRYAELLKEKE